MEASFDDAERLLRETSWVRALAGRLTDDPALADDLAQETLLRALQRPSRRGGGTRAWLAAVLRNVLRQGRRSDGRRAARERETGREERQPSTSDAVGRLELQREVVEAVLSLAEPYRSTIVERYLEERPPREIAVLHGVPVATVKSRIARGIAELRVRLDRTYGDRRAWGLALLPLLSEPPARSGLILESLRLFLMGTTPKLVLGGLSAAGIAFVLYAGRDVVAPPQPEAAAVALERSAQPLSAPGEELEPVGSGVVAERVDVAVPEPEADEGAPIEAVAVPAQVEGEVLDPEGRALSGLEVFFRPRGRDGFERFATSGAGGRFAGDPPSVSGGLFAQAPGYATLLGARFDPGHPREALTVVAAPVESYAGRVVDPDGLPLAGVELRVLQPQTYRERMETRLHRTTAVPRTTETDALGRFALDDVPFQPDLSLQASLEGYQGRDFALPGHSDVRLVLELRPLETDEASFVAGVVLDPDGRPVEGALVSGGGAIVRSDARGEFELERSRLGERIRATARGFLPAVVERGPKAWPDFVELALLDPPLSLSGRVVDVAGRPLSDHFVWIDDPTLLGRLEGSPVIAESASLGGAHHRVGVMTDGDGRFTLGGLAPRSYSVRVMDRETVLIVDAGRFEAGREDLEILVDGAYRPTITGRVVGTDGEPVEGVGVRVEVPAYSLPDGGGELMAVGVTTTTGPDGDFALDRVPVSADALYVSSNKVMRTYQSLADEQLDPIEIHVRRRVFVHVIARPDLPADTWFQILDVEGGVLGLTRREGTAYSMSDRHRLSDGSFDIVSCAATASTLVLSAGEVELERLPIALAADEVTRIDL